MSKNVNIENELQKLYLCDDETLKARYKYNKERQVFESKSDENKGIVFYEENNLITKVIGHFGFTSSTIFSSDYPILMDIADSLCRIFDLPYHLGR